MPGSTARAKISKGIRGATAPVSERQQLALLMQMTSDDNQGPGPGQAATSGDAAAHGVGGGSGTATGPGPTLAATSPAANPSPSRSKARNERGETPLHLAAIKGDLSQVRRLLEAGSDPNVADFAGWTPLHEASNHGWLRVAGALLRAGAHVNVKGWDDDTPLHDAAVNGHFKLVRLLMRHGADPHLRNVRGKTPLDVARQDVVFLMTDTNPFSSDSDSDLLRSDEDDAEGADRSDRATDGSTTSVSRGAARALVLPRTPPTRRNSTASGAASARGAPAEMRRAPPQNKAVEKPASPRVTLRLHHLKTRDDRKAANKPTERESLSNNRSQLSGNMEGKGSGEDVYEFKSSKEATPVRGASASPEPSSKMNESTNPSDNKERDSKPDAAGEPPHAGGKRNATEMVDGDEGDEETRRKKRKETENPSKENTRNSTPSRSANGRNGSANSDKSKPAPGKISSNLAGKPNSNQDKNPELKSGTSSGSNSPKPTTSGSAVSSSGSKSVEGDSEDTLGGKGGSEAIGPKVPPLKIVIPQQSAALEPEPGTRVGKNGNSRHHQALPYVVASSNSNDSVPEKEGGGSGSASPTDSLDKKDSTLTEDQRSALNHQRVLRSSNRSGNGGANPSGSRSSSPTAGSVGGEDTSPQQSRQQSPAPVENAASSVPETTSAPSPGKSSTTSIAPANVVVDEKPGQTEASTLPPQSTPTPATQTSSMELHPRKRKLKPHREQPPAPAPSTGNSESTEPPYTSTEVHPHEQPITNCYQLFLNIRKQIERRRKNLFPVQPKPPQGFKDYLMNRCTYVLTSNASTRIAAPNSPPASLIGGLRDLFVDQEKERQKLKMQHIIEKEKLVLSVEQEILRVHGRAARALANQALPFSACSILKDEEVYNVITPEQEEKDRNARSRYNGRLFLSWLQDVDDKWEKIKESMLLRHHNEAESLHAVQRMDWDWKMKEVGPCEDCPPVPMVHVSDDFDLLPA